MRIHLLAVDRPQFSLVQVGDVAIGCDVFQIGEECAIRRCGSDFEDHHRATRNLHVRGQWSAGINDEFAVFAEAVRVENVEAQCRQPAIIVAGGRGEVDWISVVCGAGHRRRWAESVILRKIELAGMLESLRWPNLGVVPRPSPMV